MTAAPVKSYTQWLDELVAAASSADRFAVSMAGMSDAGLALTKAYCDRHRQRLNWTSALRHLDSTEATHRHQHGTTARLHEVGDLRPLRPDEAGSQPPTSAWQPKRCSRPKCGLWIVWAHLASGARVPVDAEPDPVVGSVVLVVDPDDDGPLAMPLFSEQARAAVGDADLYRPHRETCRTGQRRKPGGAR